MKRMPWLTPIVMVAMILPATARPEERLTLEQVREMAFEHNRQYLSALQDVNKAGADITRARSDAFPTIDISGSYDYNFIIPSIFFVQNGQTIELQTGFKNNYRASATLTQTLWSGGKVFTALSIAKLYRQYTDEIAAQVRSEIDFQAEVLYYTVALQQANLDVLRKAHTADSANLDVVEKKYAKGVVSEFEVLRARVEKANLEPAILQAESNVRLAGKRLKSFIGMDLNEPIVLLSSSEDTSIAGILPLPELIDTALAYRPESRQADFLVNITRKAIRVARADYYPSVEAVARYDWQAADDVFSLRHNNTRSWTAGLRISVPLFNGGRTRSNVSASIADNEKAKLNQSQTADNIRLEVEEAYDRLLQAKKSLDIQGETIAQAEEGLRIANLRYASGIGTQLEVLDAQAALTSARSAMAQALFFFRQARASLKKATTVDIETLAG